MDATDKQPSNLDSLVTKTVGNPVSDTALTRFSDVQKVVSNADSLSRLIADYQRIENTQNGVCDTCVTGFVSVLIEHRTISKKLSDEIEEMNQNLQKVRAFNNKAFGLVNAFQRQSGELERIVALRANLIQENQKQVAELRQRKSDLTVSQVSVLRN